MEKTRLRLWLVLTLTLLTTSVWGQHLIKGKVTDAQTGEPLIGASVVVKGETRQGVITDNTGQFSLNAKDSNPLTLSVAYIGYGTQDVEVTNTSAQVIIRLE